MPSPPLFPRRCARAQNDLGIGADDDAAMLANLREQGIDVVKIETSGALDGESAPPRAAGSLADAAPPLTSSSTTSSALGSPRPSSEPSSDFCAGARKPERSGRRYNHAGASSQITLG